MSKFSGPGAGHPPLTGPVRTTTVGPPTTLTHEGGPGWVRDPKGELYLLAISNLVGESTFYESADARDARFADLVRQVTAEDPGWVARLVRWLRHDLHLRSVAVVAACEYVRAGGEHGRAVIDSACARADEPAEVVGYWLATHGRKLPQPVKRGVADAAVRLYTERAALKYDGQSRGVRMADVLELTHPRPSGSDGTGVLRQSELFRWLLDRRHGRGTGGPGEHLTMVRNHVALRELGGGFREMFANPIVSVSDTLANAGMTWEAAAGLYGELDARFWTAMIPSMGYMALLRNLRNFDEAGVSDEVAAQVVSRLTNPVEVAASRQLPIRFFSAWKAVAGMRWAHALEVALGYSLTNVPALRGRTLVLVDCSGSMRDRLSARGEVARWEVAAVFAHALALRADEVDLYAYSTAVLPLRVHAAGSILRSVEALGGTYDGGYGRAGGGLWGGTDTFGALAATYRDHDRVVLLTDEQAHSSYYSTRGDVLGNVKRLYTFNLGGYRPAHAPSRDGHVTFGGLSDAGFRGIELLERHRDAGWPF